jgi:hypothetical protein
VGRRVGLVLVFLGLFLLFFAILERGYAYPRLKKAPLDQYSKPVAVGTGSYFNRNVDVLREVSGVQLTNVRTVRGDVRAGSEDVAVWDSFSSTVASDGGLVQATQERIALDRVTAESVHCCGENPRHEGLTLKFPFDTRKQTYQFWDTGSERAAPAVFTRQEKLQGLTVYRFEQRFDRLTIGTQDLPGSLAGQPGQASVPTNIVYSNVKTLWVEPATGIIVKAQQDVDEVLDTLGGEQVLTLVDAVLTYDDATVDHNADEASSGARQLRLLGLFLPGAALVVGLALLLGGLAMLRPPEGRRVRRAEGSSHPAGAA